MALDSDYTCQPLHPHQEAPLVLVVQEGVEVPETGVEGVLYVDSVHRSVAAWPEVSAGAMHDARLGADYAAGSVAAVEERIVEAAEKVVVPGLEPGMVLAWLQVGEVRPEVRKAVGIRQPEVDTGCTRVAVVAEEVEQLEVVVGTVAAASAVVVAKINWAARHIRSSRTKQIAQEVVLEAAELAVLETIVGYKPLLLVAGLAELLLLLPSKQYNHVG